MKTNTNISGTSFYDKEIKCSVNDLIKVLGKPTYDSNDGRDKTNIEWTMETDGGIIFTLYDYKMYRPITFDEPISWHIGTRNQQDSENIFKLLETLI
jgi:hypothetical protein